MKPKRPDVERINRAMERALAALAKFRDVCEAEHCPLKSVSYRNGVVPSMTIRYRKLPTP